MRLLGCLLASACLASACLAHEPGTVLGTYAVTGTLEKQTCSLGAEDPWKFDVRLSKQGETLFWLQDSSPPLSGTLDPQGNATIKTTETIDLQDSDGGVYCSVQRTDTFTAVLGTAATPSGFTGSLAYHYDVDPSGPCAVISLPCDVSYGLAAKLSQAGP